MLVSCVPCVCQDSNNLPTKMNFSHGAKKRKKKAAKLDRHVKTFMLEWTKTSVGVTTYIGLSEIRRGSSPRRRRRCWDKHCHKMHKGSQPSLPKSASHHDLCLPALYGEAKPYMSSPGKAAYHMNTLLEEDVARITLSFWLTTFKLPQRISNSHWGYKQKERCSYGTG